MISPTSQDNSVPTPEFGGLAEAGADSRATPRGCGVFLMTDSLETGGSERQFSALARSLNREMFRVHVGSIQRKGPFLEGLGDVSEFPVAGSLYGIASLKARWRLARYLKRHEISIAHAFDFYSNFVLIPAARWARVPVVIGSQRQLGDLLTRRQERAQAAVLRWCDTVVCNSRAAAARLMALGLRESQLAVIGNGLPPEAFAETPPALPRSREVLRVGMIARMNTRAKNHHLFLRVAARLCNRFPALQFVLVGDGPLRPELEREAYDRGLGERVLFLGDQRDVPAVLASLDVSVLPSASESLSNVILESMAANVPVVANRVGGNCELITQDRGLLVPPDDEEALTDAIGRLLRDTPFRRVLAGNASAFVRENFTLGHMSRRHEALYQDLLEKKRRRASAVRLNRGNSKADRLKVTIVAPSLQYVGGQSVQADLLLRHWQDDPDVEARFIRIDPAFPSPLRWVEHVPFLRTLVRQPLYLFSLWRGLQDADIAHIFSASYWSFLVAPAPAWMIARLRGKKTLIHYHSGEARDHLRRFHSAPPVLKRADRLVVPSGYLVDVFREFGLEAQAIPNIADVSQFSFRVRRPLRPHLVCTRGFHPYYCIDVVVRAFAEVQDTFPDARLDLVGGGPLENDIRNLVRERQITRVDFKGVAARNEIGRFYDQADIFINGSRLDNMPVSVLEAFASGMPVVSTEPEGMRYVVEHGRTGLLSAPGDAAALARNVIRVLQDPALAERLVANAREESQRCSWLAVRGQWLEVYRALASGETKRAREFTPGSVDSPKLSAP
jgi:glycosyltransferase involved in cell wall biosynthesis